MCQSWSSSKLALVDGLTARLPKNLSLVDCMAVVEDPRVDRTKTHELQDILGLSVLDVLCDADGWEDIELFAKIRFSCLKKFIKLSNGVPSHDTISRVFRMIRPDAFQEAFLACVSDLNCSRSSNTKGPTSLWMP